MCLIWSVGPIVAGQTVCYRLLNWSCRAIHMLDGKILKWEMYSHHVARQMGLSLKVFETLVVCNYDKFPS